MVAGCPGKKSDGENGKIAGEEKVAEGKFFGTGFQEGREAEAVEGALGGGFAAEFKEEPGGGTAFGSRGGAERSKNGGKDGGNGAD